MTKRQTCNAFLFSTLILISTSLQADKMMGSPSAEGAQAYIVTPQNGDTVPSKFKVVFGLTGMGVAPAGTEKANTGHHHLLIDTDTLPTVGQPMGSDVKHFGGGQTETSLSLPPGSHTLQLILGDMSHVPHNPPVVSEKITIMVK